jgi:peptidoglycan hydrolase CwlO-like protein
LRHFDVESITGAMKMFILLVCASALSLSTIRSDDACCEDKAATVQAQLRDIDLKCLLTKYEALQTAKVQAEIQYVLLETESEKHETELSKLQNRINRLVSRASEVRQQIEEMSKPVAVAAK